MSMAMLRHVGEVLATYGGKSPAEIPSLLVTLTRQYDIELPDESGILAPAFWQRHLSRP